MFLHFESRTNLAIAVHLAMLPTLWLPGLLPTVLSAFLYNPLEAVILFHLLPGLQLPLSYQ